jgi:hypothetical protein
MRGQQERSGSLFSYVSIEDRIPASHPLRRIRKLADQALNRVNPTGVGRAGASFRARAMGALSPTEKTAGSDQPIPHSCTAWQEVQPKSYGPSPAPGCGGAADVSGHAALDLLEGFGRVHQEPLWGWWPLPPEDEEHGGSGSRDRLRDAPLATCSGQWGRRLFNSCG